MTFNRYSLLSNLPQLLCLFSNVSGAEPEIKMVHNGKGKRLAMHTEKHDYILQLFNLFTVF